jgi:hypothetical protein
MTFSTELSQRLTINCFSCNFPIFNLGADPMENTAFYCPVLFYACLMIRCLAIDVLLLRALATAGNLLPSRCLSLELYARASQYLHFCFPLSTDTTSHTKPKLNHSEDKNERSASKVLNNIQNNQKTRYICLNIHIL